MVSILKNIGDSFNFFGKNKSNEKEQKDLFQHLASLIVSESVRLSEAETLSIVEIMGKLKQKEPDQRIVRIARHIIGTKINEEKLKNNKKVEAIKKHINEKNIAKLKSLGVDCIKDFIHSTNFETYCIILFDNHVYESIRYYETPIDLKVGRNPGEILFPFTEKKTIDTFLKEFNESDSQKQEFMKLQNDKCKLIIKDPAIEQGLYHEYNMVEITFEKFLEITQRENIVGVIQKPTTYLCLSELIERGVFKDSGSMKSGFSFSQFGFTNDSVTSWEHLMPIKRLNTAPKKFQLEITVATPKSFYKRITSGGHASLSLITPSGEVYNLGFIPTSKALITPTANLKVQEGALSSPDGQIGMSEGKKSKITKLIYKLPEGNEGKIAFLKLLDFIENKQKSIKGENNGQEYYYHPIYHNCAKFAKDVRDYAVVNLGAKAEKLNNHKLTTLHLIVTRIIRLFTDLFLKFQKRFFGLEDFYDEIIEKQRLEELENKEMLMPEDLIYEHIFSRKLAAPLA